MRGDARCHEKPDDGTHSDGDCCVHPCPGRSQDLICCWCGNLFVADEEAACGNHGPYLPKLERVIELTRALPIDPEMDRRAARALSRRAQKRSLSETRKLKPK